MGKKNHQLSPIPSNKTRLGFNRSILLHSPPKDSSDKGSIKMAALPPHPSLPTC